MSAKFLAIFKNQTDLHVSLLNYFFKYSCTLKY